MLVSRLVVPNLHAILEGSRCISRLGRLRHWQWPPVAPYFSVTTVIVSPLGVELFENKPC